MNNVLIKICYDNTINGATRGLRSPMDNALWHCRVHLLKRAGREANCTIKGSDQDEQGILSADSIRNVEHATWSWFPGTVDIQVICLALPRGKRNFMVGFMHPRPIATRQSSRDGPASPTRAFLTNPGVSTRGFLFPRSFELQKIRQKIDVSRTSIYHRIPRVDWSARVDL